MILVFPQPMNRNQILNQLYVSHIYFIIKFYYIFTIYSYFSLVGGPTPYNSTDSFLISFSIQPKSNVIRIDKEVRFVYNIIIVVIK